MNASVLQRLHNKSAFYQLSIDQMSHDLIIFEIFPATEPVHRAVYQAREHCCRNSVSVILKPELVRSPDDRISVVK